MKRMTNKSKQYHAKASVSKHRRELNRAKMRKEIAKITAEFRSGNRSMKDLKDVANYTGDIKQFA